MTATERKDSSDESASDRWQKQTDVTIGQIPRSEREQIIEECQAVMRDEMNIYRAETLSSSAVRVAIENCIVAVDALKHASNTYNNQPQASHLPSNTARQIQCVLATP